MSQNAPSKWRRPGRLILLAVLLILVAGIAASWISASRAARAEIERIRARGLPVSAADLNTYYKDVPASENAALVVLDAAALQVRPPNALESNRGDLGELILGEPLSSRREEVLADYLAKNEQAIAKLHQVRAFSRSRYPVDFTPGFATLLPALAEVKQLAELLKWNAIYLSANGAPGEAVRSVETGLAVARTLSHEPLLISDLVGIACVSVTLKSLERIVTEHPLEEAELLRLEELLRRAEEDRLPALERGMAGERAIGIGGFDLNFREWEQLNGGPQGDLTIGDYASVIAFQFRRLIGLRERDRAFYLQAMGVYEGIGTNRYPEVLRLINDAHTESIDAIEAHRIRYLVSGQLLPSLGNAARRGAHLVASLRCARTALAVERYRLDHNGALPAQLEVLQPRYLTAQLLDPFDGGRLKLESIDPKGYRIQSPGATEERLRAAGPPRKGSDTNRNVVAFSVLR